MRIAIIGAGAAGLVAALDLAKAGHEVVVFEATAQVGGLAAGFSAEHWDWSLEKFYHHWFTSDRYILELATEMGVRDKVLFPRPITSVYYEGKFYPVRFAGALDFLSRLLLARRRSASACAVPICAPCPTGCRWRSTPRQSGCRAAWGSAPTTCCGSRSWSASSASTTTARSTWRGSGRA